MDLFLVSLNVGGTGGLVVAQVTRVPEALVGRQHVLPGLVAVLRGEVAQGAGVHFALVLALLVHLEQVGGAGRVLAHVAQEAHLVVYALLVLVEIAVFQGLVLALVARVAYALVFAVLVVLQPGLARGLVRALVAHERHSLVLAFDVDV